MPCTGRSRAGSPSSAPASTRCPPGAGSSHRHWHSAGDEFLCVLGGGVTLIEEDGPRQIGPGTCHYPDIDLHHSRQSGPRRFSQKDAALHPGWPRNVGR